MLVPCTIRLMHDSVQASATRRKLLLCAGSEPLHAVSAFVEEESLAAAAQAVQHAEGTPGPAWGALQAFPDATPQHAPISGPAGQAVCNINGFSPWGSMVKIMCPSSGSIRIHQQRVAL